MSLPIKKKYVDTKYKALGSTSNADFRIDLPQSLSFPENTGFFIDDICIPHSWYLIEDNVNDKLYISICPAQLIPHLDAYNTGVECVAVKIESGNYNGADLAIEMQLKIRAYINNTTFPNLLTVLYNAKQNTIIIDSAYAEWAFKLLTPADILNKLNNTWSGENYDAAKPNDMNEILGNLEGNSPWHTKITPYQSDFLNLQPIRNIYMHSSLGNYNTLGARGETSIIKKIPVTANINEVIFDQVLTGNDFGDCSKQTLRTISFEFRDVKGNFINFRGSNLSFSIIFSRLDVSG